MDYSTADKHAYYRIHSGVQLGSLLNPFLSIFRIKGDRRFQTLVQRHLDSHFLMLYIRFVYSRAFQRMGLLHRLDQEQRRLNVR